MTISVLLISSHVRIRDELRKMLQRHPEVDIYSETDTRSGSRLIRSRPMDVVVLDTQMPTLNGIKNAGLMRAESAGAPLILLCTQSDARYVKKCFNKGVAGYLLREDAYEELMEAIRVVAQGNCYLSAQIEVNLPNGFVEESCALNGEQREEI